MCQWKIYFNWPEVNYEYCQFNEKHFIVDWTCNKQFNSGIGMGCQANKNSMSGNHP